MTAVYLLRHPETTWNAAERYQGRLESPLSAKGERQRQLTARAFAGQPIAEIRSSPLGRAHELAASVARACSARVTTDQRLTEIGQGAWEGLTRAEIKERYPELMAEWYRRPDLVRFPGGETLGEVAARALSSLQDLYERHPEGSVCVVTHSVVVQVLTAHALSLDLRHIHRLPVSNAGITTLCGREAPGALLALNLTDHLYSTLVGAAEAHACIPMRSEEAAS